MLQFLLSFFRVQSKPSKKLGKWVRDCPVWHYLAWGGIIGVVEHDFYRVLSGFTRRKYGKTIPTLSWVLYLGGKMELGEGIKVEYLLESDEFRHTSRYSRNFYDETVHQVNIIDVAYEEYAQEVVGFSDSSTSGNPTPSDPIIASSSPSFTPFEEGDFILEEIETFLRTLEELSNLDDDYYDTEGDILYLEKLLNEDPSLNLPSMKNDDLKQVDVTMTKPSIEEPPELELKDLPSHLEYAFLEGTDKKLHINF
ncbi:hypothetical protein Tco_0282249 [Tanacetum coccineum]